MNEVLRTIVNGLTYEGQVFHILINYTLIILTVLPFLRNPDSSTSWERHGWKICLGIITLLQIVVWFIADAVGVSLIWSAMAGFLAFAYWRGGFEQAQNKKRLVQIALTATFAAIVFYAVAFPVITTIAHVVALFVGLSVFLIGAGLFAQRERRTR